MRTLLLVFCALLVMNLSMEARKKPASQTTAEAKYHKAMVKKYQKSRKAPKAQHRQPVN